MEEMLNNYYVCSSKDCNMKFVEEKQLYAHKRKHDMILSLGKAGQFSSDQTPTPTRFIRNCEEIGLFQELQNVNPFEETFRIATEAVRKGHTLKLPNVQTLGKLAGEDLHTPHIDLTDDTESSLNGNDDVEVERVIRSEADTSLKHSPTPISIVSFQPVEEIKESPKSATNSVKVYLSMPDGSFVQIPTIGNNSNGIISGRSSETDRTVIIPTSVLQNDCREAPPQDFCNPSRNNISAAVKQKLKQALLKTPKAPESIFQKRSLQTTPAVTINNTVVKVKKDRKVSSSTCYDDDDDDHEKKKKCLERNRVAAMRCREKRKRWVSELRDKYDKMCATNVALGKEVSFLRSEVARLKELLIINTHPQMPQEITRVTATVSLVAKPVMQKSFVEEVVESGAPICQGRGPREGLRLDIEGASRATAMDLDSPLVRSDEILSSVAPPTTPNERLISFPELDRESDTVEVQEGKVGTTVIQINPNALTKGSSARDVTGPFIFPTVAVTQE